MKTLGELAKGEVRGLGSYYFSEEGQLTPIINIRDLHDGQVVPDTVERVNLKQTRTIQSSMIEPGDVLIAVKGSSFKAALADERVKDHIISSNIIAVRLSDEVLPEVVVAYLNSPLGQKELQARAGGGVQKSLNLKSLLEVPIPVPSPERQRRMSEYFKLLQQYNEIHLREQQLREKITQSLIGMNMEDGKWKN